jgi:uncharacterized protein YjbI with pentapeptide repeats
MAKPYISILIKLKLIEEFIAKVLCIKGQHRVSRKSLNWKSFKEQFTDGNESSRSIVLIGAAFLDVLLEKLINNFLVDIKETQTLLSENGPLSTFSSRISSAYCLGLISKTSYLDLQIIRKIRNDFAHDLNASFENVSIKDRCKNLQTYKKIANPHYSISNPPPRNQFEQTVLSISYILAIDVLEVRPDRRVTSVEVEHPKSISENEVMELISSAKITSSRPNLNSAIMIGLNLNEINFLQADMSNSNLRGTSLIYSNLSKTSLCHVDLTLAGIMETSLQESDLTNATLTGASLIEVDLFNSKLCGAKLYAAQFILVNFNQSDLSGVDLTSATLDQVNLCNAILSNAILDDVNFINSVYNNRTKWPSGFVPSSDLKKIGNNADLRGVNFRMISLKGAELRKANLSGADLSYADLSEADLSEANLNKANLDYTKLIGTNLARTDLSQTQLNSTDLSKSNLIDIDLNGAKYRKDTKWPEGFNPKDFGAILEE